MGAPLRLDDKHSTRTYEYMIDIAPSIPEDSVDE
jgi:hypothetical protein